MADAVCVVESGEALAIPADVAVPLPVLFDASLAALLAARGPKERKSRYWGCPYRLSIVTEAYLGVRK
jgi:hypothetical protein